MDRMKKSQNVILILIINLLVHSLSAKVLYRDFEECLVGEAAKAPDEETVTILKQRCKALLAVQNVYTGDNSSNSFSKIQQRIHNERLSELLPNVITAHKRNYMLPVSYVNEPNVAPFADALGEQTLDHLEAKFQLSFKAPVFSEILTSQDRLYFGFTIQSYWQVYNSDLSSPFRETNYQPEIFYALPNDWKLAGWNNRALMLGVEHQSNGQTQLYSRSWNRVYANFIFEKEEWAISFRPWYRLPEKRKEMPNVAQGDDNPDIGKYMGNFELTGVYQCDDQNFSMMFRNNLRSNNRGAIQLDWTFPMGSRFKGFVQYFNGYGESLIDYNHSIERLGFGILLTDFF
jgi:phospholipase A1